jgi:hypothetical protein
MAGCSGKNVGEPDLRVDVAVLGTLNERVDGGGSRARLALASTGTVVSSALIRKM